MNMDQDTKVFDDFGEELKAYDKELAIAAQAFEASVQ